MRFVTFAKIITCVFLYIPFEHFHVLMNSQVVKNLINSLLKQLVYVLQQHKKKEDK